MLRKKGREILGSCIIRPRYIKVLSRIYGWVTVFHACLQISKVTTIRKKWPQREFLRGINSYNTFYQSDIIFIVVFKPVNFFIFLAFPAQAGSSFTAATSRFFRRAPLQKASRRSCASAVQRAEKTSWRRRLFSRRAWGKDSPDGPYTLRVKFPQWGTAFWERGWIRSP